MLVLGISSFSSISFSSVDFIFCGVRGRSTIPLRLVLSAKGFPHKGESSPNYNRTALLIRHQLLLMVK